MDQAPPDSRHARLHAIGLRFAYPGGGFSLRLPELTLAAGETLLLAGPSGAGKTTLLRLLCGLLAPQSGSLIAAGGVPLHELSPAALRAWRLRHAGLIFQDFALLDYLTAEENILLPLQFLEPIDGSESAPPRDRLAEFAAALDLSVHLRRTVRELSQGERQRVAILRALITSPGILFADEPTASLDRKRRDQAMNLLQSHASQTGASLVLVSHDPELMADVPRHLNLEDLHTS